MYKKIYVPNLKWKRGEKIAVRNLDTPTKDKIIPVFNVMPTEEAEQFIVDIKKNWGTSRPFFFDFHQNFIEKKESFVNPFINKLISLSTQENLSILPIVKEVYNDNYLKILNDNINNLKSGYAIRITVKDYKQFLSIVQRITNKISIPINNTDLIIDMGTLIMPAEVLEAMSSLVSDVIKKSHKFNFRSIIMCGSSFPQMLTGLKKFQVSTIARIEWRIWNQFKKDHPNLVFGDYGIDDPHDIDLRDGATIIPTIRYTYGDYWYILRGKHDPDKPRDYSQYHKLSQMLIGNKIYCGKSYSWGNKLITECADKACLGVGKKCNHGNPEKWVQISTNHHITYLANCCASSL
ncbi:MAG: beta family protein [Bacillota bacterium]